MYLRGLQSSRMKIVRIEQEIFGGRGESSFMLFYRWSDACCGSRHQNKLLLWTSGNNNTCNAYRTKPEYTKMFSTQNFEKKTRAWICVFMYAKYLYLKAKCYVDLTNSQNCPINGGLRVPLIVNWRHIANILIECRNVQWWNWEIINLLCHNQYVERRVELTAASLQSLERTSMMIASDTESNQGMLCPTFKPKTNMAWKHRNTWIKYA